MLLAAVSVLYGCANSFSQWDDAGAWYVAADIDKGLADVFYILSTQISSASGKEGDVSYRLPLTDEDRTQMDAELNFVSGRMFGDSLNFIAPYYHQFTMDAVNLDPDTFNGIFEDVTAEVCDAFDWYMRNVNGGRRFIIAGFSQGAMLTLELLKHMSDEEYARLAGAYMIGYRLTAGDIAHPHVVPADNATDRGEVVSFNSVMTVDAVWPMVTDGAAATINPLNWCTDATPATLEFKGDTASVRIDPDSNLLIVSGLDKEKYRFPPLDAYCVPGNLHHWDLLFYCDAIRQNAKRRSYAE